MIEKYKVDSGKTEKKYGIKNEKKNMNNLMGFVGKEMDAKKEKRKTKALEKIQKDSGRSSRHHS